MMKKLLIPALLSLCLALCGCGADSAQDGETLVSLNGTEIKIEGRGASASGGTLTIGSAGTYRLSGSLEEGQVIVNTGDQTQDVILILDGASISKTDAAAIYVQQAANFRLQLAPGSENSLVSGLPENMGSPDENASGAALYSEDDMDIEGEGSLSVLGCINNGIGCKDDLDINSGRISVEAANNGIRGSESVEIKGGEISVVAGNDGVKSTSADKEGKGYVAIMGGSLSISAQGDGVSAVTELRLEGGSVSVLCSGAPEQQSSKGLKAETALSVTGGSLSVSSLDHCLHSAAALSIDGGELSLSSEEGKGLAAHGDILVSGGEISLSAGDDGVETVGNVSVTGGSLSISSKKDGIQAGEANSGLGDVSISGGEVFISAYKRGLNPRGVLNASGGSLFSLSGDDKSILPQDQSSLSWTITGAVGDTFSLSSGESAIFEFRASQPCSWALYSAPGLQAEAAYTLTNGRQSQTSSPN